MNVTKSGNTAGAAAPMNIDVISSDNSVNIEKTEEGKSVTYDLKVETPPSVQEITSEDNTISIVRDGARVDLSAPSLKMLEGYKCGFGTTSTKGLAKFCDLYWTRRHGAVDTLHHYHTKFQYVGDGYVINYTADLSLTFGEINGAQICEALVYNETAFTEKENVPIDTLNQYKISNILKIDYIADATRTDTGDPTKSEGWGHAAIVVNITHERIGNLHILPLSSLATKENNSNLCWYFLNKECVDGICSVYKQQGTLRDCSVYNPGESPEGDFITKSGSFFYDTFSRERRTTEKEYDGTVYQPTVGEKSICISSSAENGSIVSGANSHVEGDDNIVTGENSFVLGDNNIVKGPHNYVLGYGHRLASEAVQFGFVAGNGHDLGYSFGASVSGLYNTVNGHCPVALGQGNKVGPYSVVLGHTNDVSTGEHHVTIGTDNKNTGGIYGFMIGQGNNSNVTNSILAGLLNSGNELNNFSTLIGGQNSNNSINSGSVIIGSNNEDNSLIAGSVILGSQNKNNGAFCPYIIIGYNCSNFHPTAPAIALGERASSTPICGDIPLGLAIGVGQSRNIISADKAGNVEIAAHSVVIGNRNQECKSDGTIIIGHGCEGWDDGSTMVDGARIVLGGHARPTLIDHNPLCLAIGNGNPDDPGNCIAADFDGNVKLYGNVLFDVDGVQYSMKQIVYALKSLKAL